MVKRSTLKFVAGAVALAVILACGGSDTVAGKSFPLTAAIGLTATNNDADNIHFLLNADPFDPSNRVEPGTTKSRDSNFTKKWDNASSNVEISVFCGRNGVVLAGPVVVNMSGQDRMDGMRIMATWNGTTLTAGKH